MTHSVDSLHSGNTSPNGGRCRSRVWFITSFHDPLVHFDNAKFECWCDDLTEDNKYHFHQVVVFENQIAVRTMKKAYPTAHIEKPKKDVFTCIKYIKGEIHDERHVKTNYMSLGDEPVSTRFKTVGDLKQCEDVDQLDWKQYNTYTKIREKERELDGFFAMLDEVRTRAIPRAPKVIYLTGKPGIGKTSRAYQRACKDYSNEEIGRIQITNHFCSIINEDAKCFVIEEFRPSEMHAADFLSMIDRYGYNANTKGGFVFIRPECFIICSVLPPDQIYKDELNTQFTRRITETIDFNVNDAINEAR